MCRGSGLLQFRLGAAGVFPHSLTASRMVAALERIAGAHRMLLDGGCRKGFAFCSALTLVALLAINSCAPSAALSGASFLPSRGTSARCTSADCSCANRRMSANLGSVPCWPASAAGTLRRCQGLLQWTSCRRLRNSLNDDTSRCQFCRVVLLVAHFGLRCAHTLFVCSAFLGSQMRCAQVRWKMCDILKRAAVGLQLKNKAANVPPASGVDHSS